MGGGKEPSEVCGDGATEIQASALLSGGLAENVYAPFIEQILNIPEARGGSGNTAEQCNGSPQPETGCRDS